MMAISNMASASRPRPASIIAPALVCDSWASFKVSASQARAVSLAGPRKLALQSTAAWRLSCGRFSAKPPRLRSNKPSSSLRLARPNRASVSRSQHSISTAWREGNSIAHRDIRLRGAGAQHQPKRTGREFRGDRGARGRSLELRRDAGVPIGRVARLLESPERKLGTLRRLRLLEIVIQRDRGDAQQDRREDHHGEPIQCVLSNLTQQHQTSVAVLLSQSELEARLSAAFRQSSQRPAKEGSSNVDSVVLELRRRRASAVPWGRSRLSCHRD